ncbi:MAG TPA: HyaD/HybD family hydrogenase maturation endopeptidase [Anaerohalosphaeraceae bacterium]|jgi:hydrogenase maturation protease|nr:HyaD/HybD family hydrogenase maturation endopeptidase [Anaerohalosphaeraceae bacterium]HRT49761.1 HyaD/HybD family hydrogenase maturation endopeptidase [Anaerohalosphaeraceae bacterium]HRT85579.1 HyaD/HybD family hydrogenase maturation endopeptidase [Anaerohalosphaeraceae bacterium]
MTKDTIVLGLGNPLMGDEGIGVKLIEILQSASGDFPGADFVDAGTGGMTLLHLLAGRRKAIIIDCAFMGEPPGTIRRFTPEEVRTVKELAHVSLHEVDILNVIALARQLGECPEEIVFFGIEPESIEQRMALSETLGGRLKEYTEAISGELAAR